MVIITAAFLSGQGLWSLTTVFLLSLVGTLASDAIWFLFGNTIFKLTRKWQANQKKYQKLITRLDNLTRNKPFLALLFIKFLYGTRILTILYLSTKKISFWKFLFFDTLGTILWLIVMIAIGWMAGKGIANFAPFINKTEYALPAIVVLIILSKLVTIWMEKRINEK